MDRVPIEKVAEYASEDADVTFRLKRVLEKELAENAATRLFRELEMPLVPVLTARPAAALMAVARMSAVIHIWPRAPND